MKKLYIIIGIFLLFVFTLFYYQRHPLSAKLSIRQQEFIIDVALTEAQKTKGLSGRKVLAPHHGMLFVYENKDQYPFWMKGMLFPLDFIWIDGNIVVDITKNVLPPEGLNYHIVKPKQPVNKILEINAGEADLYNIAVGDVVTFVK